MRNKKYHVFWADVLKWEDNTTIDLIREKYAKRKR